jgi:hypothetical protein
MKSIPATLLAATLALALPATAQSRGGDAYDDGFKAGFKEGYSKGFREGLAEAERRTAAPPPPPPKDGPNGPIRIESALYGDGSKSCNATHWLGRRADGLMDFKVDVENTICGDPARGARKSLDVVYLCGTFQKTDSAYEHRSISLTCRY